MERNHIAYTEVKRCLVDLAVGVGEEANQLCTRERGSIFKEPVVGLANLLEIANNSKDQNGNGGLSFHLVLGPEASVPEDQVDSIGDVYQVVDS